MTTVRMIDAAGVVVADTDFGDHTFGHVVFVNDSTRRAFETMQPGDHWSIVGGAAHALDYSTALLWALEAGRVAHSARQLAVYKRGLLSAATPSASIFAPHSLRPVQVTRASKRCCDGRLRTHCCSTNALMQAFTPSG
jgi:hypothetical protein